MSPRPSNPPLGIAISTGKAHHWARDIHRQCRRPHGSAIDVPLFVRLSQGILQGCLVPSPAPGSLKAAGHAPLYKSGVERVRQSGAGVTQASPKCCHVRHPSPQS